jgi:hypothetical protein
MADLKPLPRTCWTTCTAREHLVGCFDTEAAKARGVYLRMVELAEDDDAVPTIAWSALPDGARSYPGAHEKSPVLRRGLVFRRSPWRQGQSNPS